MTHFLKTAIYLVISVFCVWGCRAEATVHLRTNTAHAFENARGAVLDAGLRPGVDLTVTSSSEFNGRPFLPPDRFIDDGLRAGANIISSSFAGWESRFDTILYERMVAGKLLHVYAYEPRKPQPDNTPPPAVFTTVNKIGGKTGDGIEFGVPLKYMNGKGQDSTPSGMTAQLAGLMACLQHFHPDWNWFDVKAALRATASRFAAGYDPQDYGYGAIDYHAANALKKADKLPLFPPAATHLPPKGRDLPFRINAFRQTRRFSDVLFKFTKRPSPVQRELTVAEVANLGGEPVYTSYIRKPSNNYVYRADRNETAYFVWLTMDSSGRLSRIEPYSIIGPITLKAESH